MSARSIGLLFAFIGLVLDQAFKLWLLFSYQIENVLMLSGPVRLAPFFDLILVRNKGISYGWFQQDSEMGRYGLIGFTLVVALILLFLILKGKEKLMSLALGLVLGGALGNVLDRVLHGAVIDMFHFHWKSFSWYVFNPADCWIALGAFVLVYDALFGKAKNPKSPDS